MAQTVSVIMKVEGVASELVTTKGHKAQVAMLYKFFSGLLSGGKHANIDVYSSTSEPVAASGTVTLVFPLNNGESVTIGGVSVIAGTDFPATGTKNEMATAMATQINSKMGSVVKATAVNAVVTVACKQKGVIGNFITLAKSGSNLTVSGTALVGGTGGVEGTAQNYSVGI